MLKLRGMRIRFVQALPFLLSFFPLAGGLLSAAPQHKQSGWLTPEKQNQLAERFAPVLFFHPSEKYFPCSPLFPLEYRSLDQDSRISLLGTPESRREIYLSFNLEEKARLATIYYRAYPLREDPYEEVVLEFWLYFVQNEYRARGGLFPFWFNGDHPNDLEHVHVVLRREAGNGQDPDDLWDGAHFSMVAVHTSAHEGSIPANKYQYDEINSAKRAHLLVERGSHAGAPDIDKDGWFTPGEDGDSGQKLIWGIRDRGLTWTPYSRSYADRRSEQGSIVFSSTQVDSSLDDDVGDDSPPRQFAYRLVPVEELTNEFAKLALTHEQRKEIFESEVHWFRKALGRSNGQSGKLLVPPSREGGGEFAGLSDFSSTERGFLLGGTNLIEESGAFLGARYSFLHGIKYLPDLVFEADGIVTYKGKGYLATEFLLSYPIDATLRFLGGASFVTEATSFRQHQWDWLAALEMRLGHIRIYAATRSWGPVTRSTLDFRLSYFF